MPQTVRLQGWVDTGTGRQAAQEVDAVVEGGVIVAPGGGEAVLVQNNTAGVLARDTLVYVTGVTAGVMEVTQADANAAGAQAEFYLPNALGIGEVGLAYASGLSALDKAVDQPVDTPIYLSETLGSWTLTAPTAADSIVQVVGRVAVRSAAVGQIMWTIKMPGKVASNDIQANAVIGSKIPAGALGYNTVAAVAVDHAAGSPLEILALDATHERLANVVVVATEAAAGAPDIDIGVAGTINSVVDDFGAGVWVVGDRAQRTIRIPAGENVRATIADPGTAGALAVYVQVLTPVIQSTNFAAALLTWLNGIRSYIADGLLAISTLLVTGAGSATFKTTTTAIFRIAGLYYTKAAAAALTFSAADTINVGVAGGSFWGAWLVEIGIDGTIHTKPAGGLADQVYAQEALAVAALPAVTAAHVQLGYVTIQSAAGAVFLANTTHLEVADVAAVTFYDLPAPASLPAVLT